MKEQTQLLSVDSLNVSYDVDDGVAHVVKDISFSIEQGEMVGVVGESGSGKSQTAMELLG